MPKVRLQKELMNIKRESEAAFQIREEFVRWDNVKTAHDLMDDMEVARMLLDCYDLVGGNFLIWSDQAKLAPPPLYATLRLQHVTSEGFEVLQEIKALGAWKRDTAELSQRKSKRKQTHVRRIAQVQVKKEVETDDDEDFISDDDDDYMPEDEIIPQRVIKSPRSARGRKAKKPVASSTRALEAPESGNNDGGHGTSSKPAARKRGRPRKGEVRPPPPKRGRKRKPKPEEEMGYPGGQAYKRKTHRIYQCKICEVICESQLDFRKHFNSLHTDIAAQIGHSKAKHGNGDKSEEKSESEAENSDMKKNSEKSSEIDIVTQHATVMYRCHPCNMVFKEEDVYKHRTRHDRLYTVCDTCGIMFTSCKSWKAHMSKHDAEKSGNRFICKICGHASIFLKDLKKHIKVHSKERPHVCEVCGKTFKQRNALYRHRFVHGDVKPYTCEYCGKGFINRYNLKGHVRTHTGEKPYQCDLCNANFTHNVSLKTHKKSAHGIDSWKDQQTNKEFDDINVEDPNLYTQGKVDATSPSKKDDTLVTIPLSHPFKQQPQQQSLTIEASASTETDNQPKMITKDTPEKMPPSLRDPKQQILNSAPSNVDPKLILTNPPTNVDPKLILTNPPTNVDPKQILTNSPTNVDPKQILSNSPSNMNPKQILNNPPPPNVPSHHNMPPLPVPQSFMQFSEVRQFIPLMINPYDYAGSSDMEHTHSASETAAKSFTNL